MKKLLFLLLLISIIFTITLFYKQGSQAPMQITSDQNNTTAEIIKDCGTEIDKEGATHSLDKDCFLKSFDNCTAAKIYKELYPPNNTIKTTVFVDGKEQNRCRIRVIVENKQVLPEKDNYYCYSAQKKSLDDSGEQRYLEISDCGNKKPLII